MRREESGSVEPAFADKRAPRPACGAVGTIQIGRIRVAESIHFTDLQVAFSDFAAPGGDKGLSVDERTVSQYLPRGRTPPAKLQHWLVCLRNHRDGLVGKDFFTVPTVIFRLLWVFVVLHHE